MAEEGKKNPPALEVAAPELHEVVKEARQALQEISAAITVRDLKKLEGRLMDNGRLFSFKSVSPERLEKGLQVEVQILAKLDLNAEPRDLQFERTSEYQVELSADQEHIEKTEKRNIESIIWTIPDSAELVKEFLPHPRYGENSTFDRGGNLKIIMKKINGTWTWNPFGW